MTFTPRRHKFGAKRTTVDGIEFDSKAEARRYGELRMLEKRGQLRDLELQVRYDLVVNGVKLGFYKADFRYRTPAGAVVVEDVKGVRTPIFALKAKLMKALHGVTIQEIGRAK
jgi:hypothetical protein